MADVTDMSHPVTRGELQEELGRFKQELKSEFRQDLEIWGGALMARMDAQEQRLYAELARHTNAVLERMSTMISTIDEKYADLPGRVNRLEAEVCSRGAALTGSRRRYFPRRGADLPRERRRRAAGQAGRRGSTWASAVLTTGDRRARVVARCSYFASFNTAPLVTAFVQ